MSRKRAFLLITHHSSLFAPYSWWIILLTVVRVFACNDIAGARVFCEQCQRIAQDSALQVTHAGSSQTVADLKSFGIKRARRAHLRRNFRADGNQNCGNALHLNFTLDRHDRAVTDVRSTAGQDHGIGARSSINLISNLRRSAFIHGLQLHRVAHVPDVLLRHTTDETLFL